jgi:membrane protease YdiL (CAAX protease family)
MRPNASGHGVAIYLVFTAVLSSIFYFLIAKSGQVGGGDGAYVGCLMWCPAVAALLSCKYLGRDVSRLGWKWGRGRYQIICYLIPLSYGTLIYVCVWLTGVGGFYNRDFYASIAKDFGLGLTSPAANLALYFFFTATISVIRDCPTVLGEEIGWRGFLVPELAKRHGFAATAIISGVIWALWHYPIFLLASGYNGGTPTWYYLTLFTVLLPLISFVWVWMRLKSGSIWPGVVLHAAHNTFIQQFFDPLTVDTGKTRYIAGEFGAALLVISCLLAFYFWRRRRELEPDDARLTSAVQPSTSLRMT